MIKKVYFIVGVVVLLCLLGVAGCGTDKNAIKGKYVSIYDSSIYYEFSKDGTYTTNNPGEDYKGVPFSDYGTYNIENGELTLLAGDDPEEPEFTYQMGYVYKDMICSKWEGELPLEKESEEKYIQFKFSSFLEEIQFKKDGIYEYKMMHCTDSICNYDSDEHNYEVYETEIGTYDINKNKVMCKSNEDLITTFYDTKDGIYCVNYIKE